MFFKKKTPTPPPEGFDPHREKSVIAEMLLKRSAKLILGRSELEIIRGVCQAIVDVTPHVRLAWTWFGPSDTQTIRPQVYAGPAATYAETLHIERNFLTQLGPAFATLDGKPVGPFNVSKLSPFGPWRGAARNQDIHHVLALPWLTGASTGWISGSCAKSSAVHSALPSMECARQMQALMAR